MLRSLRSSPSRPRYPLMLSFRTAVSRRRRLAAAGALAAAAAVAVTQLGPQEEPTVPVVVAAQPLAAGAVLGSQDLEVARFPRDLAPVDAHGEPTQADPASWEGSTLAAGLLEGQPVTAASVVGPGLLAGQPAGTTAVTLRVADPASLSQLRPGQRVDLVPVRQRGGSEPSPEPSGPVGRDLTVLHAARPAQDSGSLLGSGSGAAEDVLVVAAPADQAPALAAAEPGALVPVLVG